MMHSIACYHYEKKLETFNDRFWRNFFYFIDPNFMKVSEKNNELSRDIQRSTDQRSDRPNNKGDKYGPHRLNMGVQNLQ